MEEQPYQGFSPATYGAAPAYVPPPPPPPMFRPLSTGEILDRAMALYRQNFWLFAGIGAGAAAISTLSSAVRLIFIGSPKPSLLGMAAAKNPLLTAPDMAALARMELFALPLALVFVIAYGISKAAAVKAVMELSQGRSISAAEAYRSIGRRWLEWFGIVLRQYWAVVWPIGLGVLVWIGAIAAAAGLFKNNPAVVGVMALVGFVFLLAGMVLGILNYLRVSLAEVAGVVEGLGVNASLRRSRMLVAGRKGRIFLALLLVYALYMVAAGLQLPFAMLAQASRGSAHVLLVVGALVVGFVATSLVLPIASIGFTLFYLDERVRREGYDIELLLQRSIAGAAPPSET